MAFACLIFLLQKRSWWKKKNAFVRLFFLFSFLAMQVNCAWITLRAGSLSFQLETSRSLLSSYYITPFPLFSCLKTKKKHRVKKSAFFLVLPLHKKKKNSADAHHSWEHSKGLKASDKECSFASCWSSRIAMEWNRFSILCEWGCTWIALFFLFFLPFIAVLCSFSVFFFFCDFSACCCCFLTRSVWAVEDCWPFPTELKRGGHTHNSVFLFFFLTYALCLTSVCFIDSRSLWHIYTIFLFFSFCFFFFCLWSTLTPSLSLYIYILFLFRTQYCTLSKKRNKKRILKQPNSSESTSFCLTVGRGWWK